MLGNLLQGDSDPTGHRSIPAPAGEPTRHVRRLRLQPVYPRACGGTPVAWVPSSRRRRSIPAPAGEPRSHGCRRPAVEGLSPRLRGNPGRMGAVVPPSKVYPRACGGTYVRHNLSDYEEGLSPRLRGNLRPAQPIGLRRRSIPAPAGEPGPLSDSKPHRRVYPRACGGTSMREDGTRLIRGLSPRLRGNRLVLHPGECARRSIPAPAGEPSSAV